MTAEWDGTCGFKHKNLHNTDSDSIDYEKKKKIITVTHKVANPSSLKYNLINLGFPGGSAVKNLPAMQETCARDPGSIPRLGRSSGEGMATPSSILA